MKIKLLKDHLDHTAGDTIEVTEQRGQYLVRTSVGIESGEAKQNYINKPKNKKRNPKS